LSDKSRVNSSSYRNEALASHGGSQVLNVAPQTERNPGHSGAMADASKAAGAGAVDATGSLSVGALAVPDSGRLEACSICEAFSPIVTAAIADHCEDNGSSLKQLTVVLDRLVDFALRLSSRSSPRQAGGACTQPGYTWSAPAGQKNHTPNHVFTPECPKAAPFPLPARQGTHSPPLPHGTQVNADTANRDRPLALSLLLYPLLRLPASTH